MPWVKILHKGTVLWEISCELFDIYRALGVDVSTNDGLKFLLFGKNGKKDRSTCTSPLGLPCTSLSKDFVIEGSQQLAEQVAFYTFTINFCLFGNILHMPVLFRRKPQLHAHACGATM
jgi:hypothetical protein